MVAWYKFSGRIGCSDSLFIYDTIVLFPYEIINATAIAMIFELDYITMGRNTTAHNSITAIG
jgi:hypothetical protein